ncbi:TonB-dependent receptor domain-containing protein [Sphingomonas oryzagri]
MPTARNRVASSLLAIAIVHAMPTAAAYAGDPAPRQFDIPAQSLSTSLLAIGTASGRQILFPSAEMAGVKAPPVHGRYTADDAVRQVIAGTSFAAEFTEDAIYIRGRSAPGATRAEARQDAQEIVVTGTHIRGGAITSPVVSLSPETARDAGLTTLPEMLATVPQNFGGGQNPGLGASTPTGNDSSGASTINLRGLGPDATLTLLNGHRLPYSAQRQSVDISTIPLLAIDRVEVVPDGASALYGSDAVGGVANIILKRDYQGLLTSALIGGATDGGDFDQQYDALAGHKWGSGGFIAAYEFERTTAIQAYQRSYSRDLSPGLTLYPALKHHNILFSGHQQIASNLSFQIDAFYNQRTGDHDFFANDARGSYLLAGGEITTRTKSIAVAPSLQLTLPQGWQATLSGSYGQDHSRFANVQYLDSVQTSATRICYCNASETAELNASGPVLTLPAGSVALAVGAGYRSSIFRETNQQIHVHQHDYYGYGELNIPLISAAMDVPLVRRLTFTSAVRYESYPGIDKIATPKLGVLYAPTDDFDIKGSWGKSFKAPTLFQQYTTTNVALFPVSALGGSGYPSTATGILILGGNQKLKPERADTWTATLSIHPHRWSGTHLDLTYFGINFRNRIVTPIAYRAQALSNPIYADLVDFNPTDAAKVAALARGPFINVTSGSYDPSSVVAIVDNSNLNAARQTIRGVDAAFDYRLGLSDGQSLLFTGYGSYIHIMQRLSALQPETQLTGTVFYPPHFRGRAGLVWSGKQLTVSAYANYTGGVDDRRVTPVIRVKAMTTLDLALRYRTKEQTGILAGWDIVLASQNLLNDKPGVISQSLVYDPSYDTANYSPLGRVVSLSIAKRW